MRDPSRSLRTFLVRSRDGGVQAAAWCPWCETLHFHGAAGLKADDPVPDHRASHCDGKVSPLNGYDLVVHGEVSDYAAALPRAPLVGRRRLSASLDAAAHAFRSLVLRHGLGVDRAGAVVDQRIGRVRVWICNATWAVEPASEVSGPAARVAGLRGATRAEGSGLIGLLSELFGLPPGVAAVRLLAAVSLDKLDAQAQREIAAAVDAWVERRDGAA